METRKDRHIGWEKVDRCHERDTFEKVAGLDAICFNDKAYERLTADTHIYGDIYALKVDGSAVGYAIYGQVWLPRLPDAFISRIGVHPDYRQRGYGLRILNAILADLSNRPECPLEYQIPHIPGSHTALVIEINTADIDWQEQNVTVSAGLLQAVRFRYIPHRHPADFAFIAQSALGSVHVAVGLFGLGA